LLVAVVNPSLPRPEVSTATNKPQSTKRTLSSSEAQSLLEVNNLVGVPDKSNKPSVKLWIMIISTIVITIIISVLLNSSKAGDSTKSTGSNSGIVFPSQSNINSSSGGSQQINQDAKSCTNAINAATVC
jgi:hypothetical protein